MSEPRSVVHDLGYKPYEGPRRPPSRRYQVIALNMLTSAWRGWWSLRMWLIVGAMIVVGCSVAIYVLLYVTRASPIRGLLQAGLPITWADFLLPQSLQYTSTVAFIVGLKVLARAVADDTRAGAFDFYFARPIRPIDYLLGKLAGAVLTIGGLTMAGPLLIALVRVGLAGSGAEIAQSLPLIGKAALAGTVATVAYAAVPLGISALGRRAALTVAGWAALYLVIGNAASVLGDSTGLAALNALNLRTSVLAIVYHVFDVETVGAARRMMPSISIALSGVAAQVAAAIGLIYWRVRTAERTGLGGSS
jgi:ABC-2 type transport system permease protein